VWLEKFLLSQLDEAMQQRLLNELFETWIGEQLQEIASLRGIPLATFPALAFSDFPTRFPPLATHPETPDCEREIHLLSNASSKI
jgi:hypothetical protein